MSASITELPTSMIVISVLFVVGLVVVGSLYTVASDMDLGSSGNTTRTSLFNNVYSAFDLGIIAPIVIAAVAIISIIGYFRTR